MIAADTSSLVAYLGGAVGTDVDLVDRALGDKAIVLPPVVLSELLSDPKLAKNVAATLQILPLLEVYDGYWERVGNLRAIVLAAKKRARLADSLIAQSCIDHKISLITRDKDFRAFERAGLKLIL